MPIAYNHRLLIVGKTQSGKSTFARFIWAAMTGCRRIVVNVKGRLDVGVAPVYDVASIDWSAPVVNFIPRSFDKELFEELYTAILAHGGPTVVWLDEAFGVTKANYAPDSLLIVQQQGAELEIGHVVCSQRPHNIAVPLRSEAEHVVVFELPVRRDLDTVAEEIGQVDGRQFGGAELRALLLSIKADYGEHAFIWYDRTTNELHICEPLPESVVAAPVRGVAAPVQPSSTPDEEGVDLGEMDVEVPAQGAVDA